MKSGLLAVSTEEEINIGDYIQALSANQFLDSIDLFIEREKLKQYDSDKVKMIMNGWYLHNPLNWPPSEKIYPLYVAFHINSSAREALLSNESINYLKQHEPIGCRDEQSMELLKSKGVDAYFSACLTLTLGYKYTSRIKSDKVFIVDPILVPITRNPIKLLKLIFEASLEIRTIKRIATQMFGSTRIDKLLIVQNYINNYSKLFSKTMLLEAEYRNQQNSFFHKQFPTNTEKLDYAKQLVEEYSKAKLVITSRIHCALPCLGIGTNVVFLEQTKQSEASACRFGGLREFFNVVVVDENAKLMPEFACNEIISKTQFPDNKTNFKIYAEKLKATCLEFINKSE